MRIPRVAFLLALPLAAQPPGAAIESFQLPNGLRVLLLEDHQHPLIRLQLRAVWAPFEIRGISLNSEIKTAATSQKSKVQTSIEPLAMRVLEHCSVGTRSRTAFNRTVEERGLSLRLSAEPDGPVWEMTGGSPEAESAFSLLADVSTRAFPEGRDLDVMRLRLTHELHEQGSHATARIDFLRQIERPDLALEPMTENSLAQINLENLQRSISATLQPGRAVLAISGDLNLSQARQLTQLNFGTWNEGTDQVATATSRPQKGLAGPNVSISALVYPRTIVPSDRSEICIALPIHATEERERAAQELLSLWLPRYLGMNRCQIRPGAAGWRSLILTSEAPLASLLEELLSLKKSGLTADALEQAKTLWIANRRALSLHPREQMSLAAKATLLGKEPSELAIQELDLTTFNATLRSWLNLESARLLVFDPDQKPAPKTNPSAAIK